MKPLLSVLLALITLSVFAQDRDAVALNDHTTQYNFESTSPYHFSNPTSLIRENTTKAFDCLVTGTATTTAACPGSANGTATITLSGDGSGAPGTYSIDGAASQVFNSNPFTVTGLSAGNHILVATINATGCVSSPIAVSIASYQLPTMNASASPATVCNGSSTTLNASPGAAVYTWMPGSLSGQSVTVSPTSNTTYTLTAITAEGCNAGNIWARIAAGGTHNIAIKGDGKLWAWGLNQSGQLGDGSITQRNVPVQIGTSSWIAISAGNNHSLGIRSDGTLWAWGSNATGQLGDGSIVDKLVPVQIGIATDWVSVSAGGAHSLAMKANGTLWAWGANNYGQLGDGTFTQRTAPVQVGVAINWASVSTGNDQTLAIKSDGTLWSWGRNTFGQLGDGSTNPRNTPGQVGVSTDWAKVSSCYFHTLAIKTNGTLWSWGYNLYGQLGDGTTTQRNFPAQVGIETNWASIEGGLYHSVALKTNGTAWGWGYNVYGQLGEGTTTQRNVPTQAGSSTNWTSISGGIYHTEGLQSGGSLWSWGYNMNGQLGDGTVTLKANPLQIGSTSVSVTVTVNPLPVVNFSGLAATYCTLAQPVTLTGSPVGGTFSGPGISGNSFAPATAGAGTHSITYTYTDINGCTNSISKPVSVVQAQLLDYVNLQFPGSASLCFGTGGLAVFGQFFEPGLTESAGPASGVTVELGYSSTNSNPATWTNWQPASFNVQVGNNDEYSSTLNLQAGTYYYTFRYLYVLNSCGYQYGGFSSGGGNAWDGSNFVSGVLQVNALPTVTINPTAPSICIGNSATLTATGAATYNWTPGSLTGSAVSVSPTVTTTYSINATSAAGCVGGNIWASYVVGGYHNLGIKTDGTLWSSGQNLNGQIGDGTLLDRPSPVQVGTSNNWAVVSAGGFHSLGVKTDGTLWAWGSNINGQLGDGTTIDKLSPVQIGTATNWVNVSAGASHSMAMKSDGTLWAWGRNDYGQVGDGSNTQRNSPVQAGTATNWISFSAGGAHSMGIKSDGTLWTWGRNTFGQLGDGTAIAFKNVPAQMGVATNWKKISAGFFHSLGVKSDGTLWAWGYNMYGQVGDGTTTDRNSPVQIGTATNWSFVDGGLYQSSAIKTNGTLWSWGANMYGQIGDGTGTQRNSPVQIGSASNWISIEDGSYHTAGIRANGSLWAWGRNMEGQLGDGNTLVLAQPNPVQIGTTSASVTVTVKPLPVVSFSGLGTSYCLTATPVTLTGSPAGGTFNGPGVSSNIFDPAVAGAGGPYSISYLYTDPSTGCSKTVTSTVTVKALPVVSYTGLATNYCTTDAEVTLTGSPAGGVFSGVGISGNNFDPAAAGAGTHNITYSYTDLNGCSNSISQPVTVNTCTTTITVNLKLFLQGYYAGSNSMQPVLVNQGIPALSTETDTVTIALYHSTTFEFIDSKNSILSTDGLVSANFIQAPGIYFIAVKHRNSIQTWTANAVACTSSTPLYDFSTGAAMAFGDNQVMIEPGVWALYTGDVNQDDFVDVFDYAPYNDDNLSGANSLYMATDMNGDGFVDVFDYQVYNDNNLNGVSAIHP